MEEDITPLLQEIAAIMADDALFVVLTSYAIRSSFLSLHHAMDAALSGMGGRFHQVSWRCGRQHPAISAGAGYFCPLAGRWRCHS